MRDGVRIRLSIIQLLCASTQTPDIGPKGGTAFLDGSRVRSSVAAFFKSRARCRWLSYLCNCPGGHLCPICNLIAGCHGPPDEGHVGASRLQLDDLDKNAGCKTHHQRQRDHCAISRDDYYAMSLHDEALTSHLPQF